MKPTNSHPHRVLVADDQSDIRDALRLLLRREGYEIHGAASPSEALAALEAREFDAVLMDLNYARDTTSGQEGLDLLPRIQMMDSTLPVIVMTAWSSVEVAVEAMRRGARDFIPKPWGKHPAGYRDSHADRFAAGAAPGIAAGSGKSPAARGIAPDDDRGVRCDAPGAGHYWPHRAFRCECAHYRRARHRERSCRANSARVVAEGEYSNGDGERWRTFRRCF